MEIGSKIESILLAYGEPIALSKLAKVLGEQEDVIRETVEKLDAEYLEQRRGFAILRKENFVQLVSHPDCAESIRKLKRIEDETTLSPATLEVLSIIAYRSPITRSEIEMIRGVNCSSILRSLSIRGLVDRIEESGDGRSYTYSPSFSLLKILGVKTLEDLPEYANLSRNGKLYPDQKESVSA